MPGLDVAQRPAVSGIDDPSRATVATDEWRERGVEMAERVTYHVMPGERGGWHVQQEDSGKVASSHQTRTEAILAGRDLAKTHQYSLLVVHDREGEPEKQYTYGRHPRNIPGQ